MNTGDRAIKNLLDRISQLEAELNIVSDENKFLISKDNLRNRLEDYVSSDKVNYIESVQNVLDDARKIIKFNCGEYIALVNSEGMLPKKGEILSPMDDPWFFTWISGVGYDKEYVEEAQKAGIVHIKTSKVGPPESLFNPDYMFEPLVVLNNPDHMKLMEEQGRVVPDYLSKVKKIYIDTYKPDITDPEELEEWFSKKIYQIHVCATRNVDGRKEMYGLFIFDTPGDIDLKSLPTDTQMSRIDEIISALGTPVRFKGNLEERDALNARLASQNEELEKAYSDLKESSEQIALLQSSQLLADVAGTAAHDMGNALGAMNTHLDIARLSMDKGKPDKAKAALEKVKGLQERVNSHIAKMRNLSNPVQDYQKQGIVPALDDVLGIYENKLNITKDYRETPKVTISSQEVGNAYHNLILNTLRAYEENNVPMEKRDLTVKTYVEDKKLVVEFKDKAGGIPKEDLEKAFDTDYTTKKAGEGKGGLGLKSCQIIMAQHRGDIKLDSDGKGTTVKLYFPVNGKK